MEAQVGRELGMEREPDHAALAHPDRLAAVRRHDLDPGADRVDARRADEHAVEVAAERGRRRAYR